MTYSEHQQRELDASSSRSLDRIGALPAIMTGSVPMSRSQRIAELEARGFVPVGNTGTAYWGYRKGAVNVDVGPRGGVSCWRVTVRNGSTVGERLTWVEAIRRPLFVPCATCPDEDWCGANDCWWNADQGEP